MQQSITAPVQPALHPDTAMGLVALTVADLARSRRAFTRRSSASPCCAQDAGHAVLGAAAHAAARPARTAGRRAVAAPTPPASITSPSWCPAAADLARSLLHLAESGYPLGGASDHLVSEALYLADPDGNGIEIYRDRPRADWPRRNGAHPDGDRPARPARPAARGAGRPAALDRPGRRHPPGPYAPPGGRYPAGARLLSRRARLRRDGRHGAAWARSSSARAATITTSA